MPVSERKEDLAHELEAVRSQRWTRLVLAESLSLSAWPKGVSRWSWPVTLRSLSPTLRCETCLVAR